MIDDMVEMEFRDGKRFVPRYLANLMNGIETFRFSYEDAVQAGNRLVEANFLNAAQDRVLAEHFREKR